MRIVAVCGAGVGTSAILATTVRRALQRMDVEADVAASSAADLGVDAADAQLVLTTPEWADRVRAAAGRSHVAVVDRIMDLDAVQAVLEREL
ncbi:MULTISPECIES: PTS ascorbate transporter subunit IIB [unclassified Agrococcus]|uniref:PTS ascorbate transporter subunit IIB n=1 Tax=unclassified Agrococcus TaxID=2615065 RepID=UPI0036183759